MHRFAWWRAIVAWLLVIVLEVVHGIARMLFLAPRMGDLRARQIGVVVGSALVLAIALLTVRWMGQPRSPRLYWAVGAAWGALTAVFDFALGTVLGYSTERLWSDYDVRAGGYLGLGLVFMVATPWVAHRLRS